MTQGDVSAAGAGGSLERGAAVGPPNALTRLGAWLRRMARRPFTPAIARRVRAESLTYLEEAALADLYAAVAGADRRGEPGDLVEVGCALGGSALVMAHARSAPPRPLLVYDVFGMPPPPSEGD